MNQSLSQILRFAQLTLLLLAAAPAAAQDAGVPGDETDAGPSEPLEQPAAVAATAVAAPEPAPAEEAAAETIEDTIEASAPDAEEGGQSEWERWFGEGFLDTRITFVFADDNVLSGPKDRSPEAGFGSVDDEMFFENLQSEKRGQETETQLVLYKRVPSYFHHLDAEAALVIELENWVNEETYENGTSIGDDGSYLKFNVYTRRDDFDGDHVSLTLFPMDSQRFLLGYTYDITWGGERIFPNRAGQVPGARLRYDFNVGEDHQGYAFLGMKTARLNNTELNELQTYYGGLAGFGIGLTSFLDWELSGGYFERGAFPPQGLGSTIGGKTAQAFGGSTRVTVHQGLPIANSVDFRLYKHSPDAATLITEHQAYDDGIDWLLSGEFTYVGQTLIDFEDFNSTSIVPAKAAAVAGKLRFGNARLHADFIYRDLSYVVFDVPGFASYTDFPDGADIQNEWFVAGGIDYFFETPRLTPGVILGYKQPATVSTVIDTTTGPTSVTMVYRDEDDREVLPAEESNYDILAAKLTLRWDLAPFFVVLGELRYTLDKNRAKYVASAEDPAQNEKVFEETNVTNRLGFSLLAQARW